MFEKRTQPIFLAGGDQTALQGQPCCQHHTGTDGLAVGNPGHLFDGVPEGVAKVELAPLAGFFFVPVDDRGFDDQGIVNQAFNYRARARQTSLDFTNSFIDESLKRVECTTVQQVCDRAFSRLADRVSGFAFSFDVDALDPLEAPGVQWPARGG